MKIKTIKPDYKHHLFVVMTLFSIIFIIGTAYAETKATAQPAKNACKADYEQYCRHAAGDKRQIAQCMKKNESRLSAQCQSAIKQAQQRFHQLKQACRHDVQQHCSDVQAGSGRIFHCLQQHNEAISNKCKDALQEVVTL